MQEGSQSHDTFSPEQFKKVKANEQKEIMLTTFLESEIMIT